MSSPRHLLLGLASASLLLSLLVPPAAAQPEPGQTFDVKVTEGKEGDTFDAQRSDGPSITVRLFGVDAPELEQAYGEQAKAATEQYIGGKTVRVTVEETDVYGRTLGSVEVDGENLSEMLVRDGLAWHDERYAPNATELARLEKEARKANRGFWSLARLIAPWDWRMGERRVERPGEPSPPDLPYDPEGPDRDCSDVSSQEKAQQFYEAAGGPERDPHRLNGDGVACDSLQ